MYLYVVSVESIFAKHFSLLYSIRLDLASIRTCYLCIEGFVIYSLKPSVFVSWQSSAVDAYKSFIRFSSEVVGKPVKLKGRRFFFRKISTLTSRLVLRGSISFSVTKNANRTESNNTFYSRITITEICFYCKNFKSRLSRIWI